ncbi:hypothetical protein CERSUDRAFT_117556 [Gelatoporia subvermispora B]|uniref:Uncharacterized protein n=1 Tax=Ceriporiopsis subvermispora (strain B) TaxID=914234 RepID=M2PDY1_CERS8|nr:hypothetical protein CERSUDRAFT_117556 [Gelatoporia subvermispora B]
MPTVPSTLSSCVHGVDADALPSLPANALHHPNLYGPTPDPDFDDLELVPVENGNAVTEAGAPPQAHNGPAFASSPVPVPERRSLPRMHLPNIALHSPSAIVGTPFDLSPRFEYPFSAAALSEPDVSLAASLAAPFAAFSVLPSSASLSALPAGAHTHTHRHPKLQSAPRHPPVPPGLASKRRKVNEMAPPIRPRSSSLDSVDVTTRTLGGVPIQISEVQEMKAALQRQQSDVTVVDQESKGKAKAEVDAEAEDKGGDGIPLTHPEEAGITFLGRTTRTASDTSVTDVDPAEDTSAAQLLLDDSNDYRPSSRSGAASPAPVDTLSSSTAERTRRIHDCVEA